MLNVLRPRSNHPLPASATFDRNDPYRLRADSHPPSADGSQRHPPVTSEHSLHQLGRMGHTGPTWVGNAQPHGTAANGFIAPHSGVPIHSNHIYPAKNAYRSVPADPVDPASSAKPTSTAPAARYQPSNPVHAPEFEALGNETVTEESNGQIVSYLQIPSSINDSKGSLSDFAAQITCFFWFESSLTLHRVEEASATPIPNAPLVDEAKPCMGFRKWVTTMLSTTQVTQNVILLALLFIYRLKKQNPQVKGKPGSEYRLLTVALMLGNKFLDDNTYTNKTWADVSGIVVGEIHVMEVEFLSNMRYNLYTSDQEWVQWHKKLARFWDYFNRASKAPIDTRALPGVALPSPPQSQRSSPSFRSYEPTNATTSAASSYLAPSLPNVAARIPEFELRHASRKRSYDEGMDEPPAKRVSRGIPAPERPTRARGLSDGPMPSFAAEQLFPRLPMPAYSAAYTQAPIYSNAPAMPHPTGPQTRAMTMVYGGPQTIAQPYTTTPGPYLEGSNLGRLQIPPASAGPSRPLQAMATRSATGSPTNMGPGTGAELLSPASYAINRSSPYRPVRTVNTLLVPPPSTSFQNPPLHLGAAHMHYQPLGRPLSERRTGVVPFVHHDPAQWAHYSPFR